MPILQFAFTIAFFIVINLFLALFLSSIVLVILRLKKINIETLETNFLVFICCASLWLGMRIIILNFYDHINFAESVLWPMGGILPKDILIFLDSSMSGR